MNIKFYMEKRNDLLTDISNICDKVEAEKRVITDEENQIVSKKMKEVVDIDKTIELENKKRELIDKQFSSNGSNSSEDKAIVEEKKFLDYLTNNTRKSLSVSANGALIPETISNKIVEKVYELCPLLKLIHIEKVKGTFTVPVYDDTTDIECNYVVDLTELTECAGNFKEISFTNQIAGALTIISKSLMNNTEFDLLNFVVHRMALSVAKFLSKECLTGNTKMQGIFGENNVTNNIKSKTFNDDALITIQNSIPTAYQSNCCWVMNRDTLLKCKKLKDANGRSLLNPDLTRGYGFVLLGQPIYIDMYVPEDNIFYGDLTGYWLKFSQELEISVLYEKYATKHAIGVYCYIECDGKPVEQQKLGVLTISAT